MSISSPERPTEPGKASLRRFGLTNARLAMIAAAILTFLLAYAATLQELYATWRNDANYSHGLLVIPIAIAIFWRRLEESPLEFAPPTGFSASLGLALLGMSLGLRAFAYEYSFQWIENASLIPAAAGMIWCLGGPSTLRAAWPALVFLVFMLPLPHTINSLIALPLQSLAATGSRFLLQLSGIWAVQMGNVIRIHTPRGIDQLDVAQACNGLSMLMSLAATVTATILLIPLPIWKRVTLLLSAVPIAIACNILRIFTTGWAYYLASGVEFKKLAHDWAGFLMMPVALLIVGLELGILGWLVPKPRPEDEEKEEFILAALARRDR